MPDAEPILWQEWCNNTCSSHVRKNFGCLGNEEIAGWFTSSDTRSWVIKNYEWQGTCPLSPRCNAAQFIRDHDTEMSSFRNEKCHTLFTCEKLTKQYDHMILLNAWQKLPWNISAAKRGFIPEWMFAPLCSYDTGREYLAGMSVSFRNENLDELLNENLIWYHMKRYKEMYGNRDEFVPDSEWNSFKRMFQFSEEILLF